MWPGRVFERASLTMNGAASAPSEVQHIDWNSANMWSSWQCRMLVSIQVITCTTETCLSPPHVYHVSLRASRLQEHRHVSDDTVATMGKNAKPATISKLVEVHGLLCFQHAHEHAVLMKMLEAQETIRRQCDWREFAIPTS